jgi:hypothetical protein
MERSTTHWWVVSPILLFQAIHLSHETPLGPLCSPVCCQWRWIPWGVWVRIQSTWRKADLPELKLMRIHCILFRWATVLLSSILTTNGSSDTSRIQQKGEGMQDLAIIVSRRHGGNTRWYRWWHRRVGACGCAGIMVLEHDNELQVLCIVR